MQVRERGVQSVGAIPFERPDRGFVLCGSRMTPSQRLLGVCSWPAAALGPGRLPTRSGHPPSQQVLLGSPSGNDRERWRAGLLRIVYRKSST